MLSPEKKNVWTQHRSALPTTVRIESSVLTSHGFVGPKRRNFGVVLKIVFSFGMRVTQPHFYAITTIICNCEGFFFLAVSFLFRFRNKKKKCYFSRRPEGRFPFSSAHRTKSPYNILRAHPRFFRFFFACPLPHVDSDIVRVRGWERKKKRDQAGPGRRIFESSQVQSWPRKTYIAIRLENWRKSTPPVLHIANKSFFDFFKFYAFGRRSLQRRTSVCFPNKRGKFRLNFCRFPPNGGRG